MDKGILAVIVVLVILAIYVQFLVVARDVAYVRSVVDSGCAKGATP